ncbi:hypothetical protein RclHR1_08200006 [Rhizophagus clarus]|uniref:Uncharacterized protein LOC112591534 n=1 Tax=Rhizophagus clarus TaxID=94130 RepID=A0A2Z6S088_9GLOM|nr:hypothetical protein RclHR1_08200006 [Rhizophagus clarus]GES99363.1 uncharacterized protein LOC112591534 [Rhizophagus clarus]
MDQHYLKKASDHNHTAEASRAGILKTINILKEQAQQTNNQPVQVIQEIVANSSQETYPYLSSHDAFRQSIKRIRHINIPTEPQSLESLNIPENMKKTLDGSNFLIRDSTIGCDRILNFTTVENLKQLEISPFWIMDGIFKTVPTIFKQLYTIHGCVGNENSHFEKAAINATQAEFQNMQNKGYHFHLAQNIYRKEQHSGLATYYGTNEEFSLLIQHIPALVFLPSNEISFAFNELKENMPVKANEIMDWFENYYVHGIVQHRLR